MPEKTQCIQCEEKPRYYGDRCASCFSRYVEKQVKQSLKEQGWLQRGARLIIEKPDTLLGVVGKHLLLVALKGFPAEIVEGGKAAEGESDKIIKAWSLEHELNERLRALIAGKKPAPREKNEIRFLKYLSLAEIKAYAELRELKGSLDEAPELIKPLLAQEKNRPGTLGTFTRGLEFVQR